MIVSNINFEHTNRQQMESKKYEEVILLEEMFEFNYQQTIKGSVIHMIIYI